MDDFILYFKMGLNHVLDFSAYDHILFLIVLAVVFNSNQWKKVLWLVTLFTIGHSITLALAALNIISFSTTLVEFLIPVTILLTSLFNVWKRDASETSQTLFTKKINITYLLALFFGTIHGMGFSNFLRATLMPGEEDALIAQLFAFNIGVELGQLIFIGIVMVLWQVLKKINLPYPKWTWKILPYAMGIIASFWLVERVVAFW